MAKITDRSTSDPAARDDVPAIAPATGALVPQQIDPSALSSSNGLPAWNAILVEFRVIADLLHERISRHSRRSTQGKSLMGPRLAVSQLDCGGPCGFRRFARSAASLR
jgi:hypothetical protein